MTRQPIPIDQLAVRVHHLWSTQWLLLTSGNFAKGRYNTMTVGWGSFGTMWSKPVAMVVVRPGRHTNRFMEEYPTFTLSAFKETHRKALQILGSKSGRDGDKIRESGLTPVAASQVAAPAFAEADLIIECRQIYRDAIDPAGFMDPSIDLNYPQRDYHRIYLGEVVIAHGTQAYHACSP